MGTAGSSMSNTTTGTKLRLQGTISVTRLPAFPSDDADVVFTAKDVFGQQVGDKKTIKVKLKPTP